LKDSHFAISSKKFIVFTTTKTEKMLLTTKERLKVNMRLKMVKGKFLIAVHHFS